MRYHLWSHRPHSLRLNECLLTLCAITGAPGTLLLPAWKGFRGRLQDVFRRTHSPPFTNRGLSSQCGFGYFFPSKPYDYDIVPSVAQGFYPVKPDFYTALPLAAVLPLSEAGFRKYDCRQ